MMPDGVQALARRIRRIQGVSTPLMDRTLVCRECGASFVFTQGEQDFYQSRGLANPPSRCPKCRAVRRAQMGPPTGTITPFSRPPDTRTMYPATCGRCGQPTQVPFQPRGDRPVYCSNCFHAERAATAAATPAWTPRPSFTPVAPAFTEPATPEEGRRERRPVRKFEPPRQERGERVRYNRRANDFSIEDEESWE